MLFNSEPIINIQKKRPEVNTPWLCIGKNFLQNNLASFLSKKNVYTNMKEDVSRKLVKDIFPNEIWEYVHGVYVAKTRKAYSEKSKNAKQIFEKEMDTAKILVKNGCSVWLLPENRANMKNPDAVVDGLIYDFKQVKFSRVEHGFLEGLRQAKNVVIRLNGDFSVRRIFGKLKSHFHNRDGRLIIILNKKIYSVNLGDRRQ